MPRASIPRIPSPCRHKASGQAVVRLNGKDFYLGPYGSDRARVAYERLLGEWLANGRQPFADHAVSLKVFELIAAYWPFAEAYYVKDGSPTCLAAIGSALRFLNESYGEVAVADFGPLALKAIRQNMIAAGHSRGYINSNIDRIRRCFKWGVSEQLVPVAVYQALLAVAGLRKGKTTAREPEPVKPVPDAVVEATLPCLPPVVADMVRFQRAVGCRPGEVCSLRPCDVDRTNEVWEYRPDSHKTEHHGRERVVFIGPRAQAVLSPYLLRPAEAFCFCPAESEAARKAAMRAQRRTKVQPSQQNRAKSKRRRPPRDRYTKDSYYRAIQRACRKADLDAHQKPENAGVPLVRMIIPNWHPNQLRHLAATEIRRGFGLEAAQAVLGHSKADVTQIYAERDLAKAAEVMKRIG